MPARAQLRIDESASEARAFRAEVIAWRKAWDTIDTLGAHLTQLDLMANVVVGLIDDIAAGTEAINARQGTGQTYDECREQDRKLLHARRLWQWYAEKLDQRTSDDGVMALTLKAADEIIWSCWKTAFTALQAPVPAAPIAYIVPEFSPFATPRTDPPAGLRPGSDDLLRRHIAQLPVPLIGLPPICVRRPWWLIVAAHETSHHIQFETEGLEQRTQDHVVKAASEATGDSWLAGKWRKWCRELFADACSVLLVGNAAIWAVRELETRPAEAMRKSLSPAYPPPTIRLAVLDAVAERVGLPRMPDPDPDAPHAPAGPDDDASDYDVPFQQLLACVPAVAAALLDLTSASNRMLRSLGDQTARAWADHGGIAGWRAELLGADAPVPRQTLDAARFCAAAGVTAWQRLSRQEQASNDEPQQELARRLRGILPSCREPGTRAAGAVPDTGAIIRQFLDDLDAQGTGA